MIWKDLMRIRYIFNHWLIMERSRNLHRYIPEVTDIELPRYLNCGHSRPCLCEFQRVWIIGVSFTWCQAKKNATRSQFTWPSSLGYSSEGQSFQKMCQTVQWMVCKIRQRKIAKMSKLMSQVAKAQIFPKSEEIHNYLKTTSKLARFQNYKMIAFDLNYQHVPSDWRFNQ